ncbi:LysR substrate-binding domain-containing protein [Aminobacter sp. AP02]|uniref:LysR substrate-binding domain-containing protein n=1 Tax=Aminobacter sp. AP02 TaxID=2135737 RepID=UPI000D6C7441|nr:LysR substrate-binding domain-containing protein [Aminobacter sp. AP02]PWK72568.1 LysR family glycine cleavage system transcriptional activator [Aminobacter sp. AP02]
MYRINQLPPLTAIRAFEASARLGSFTKAAEELGTTQAAVSYQIKLLEERAGTPLFLRRPKQTELTDAGRALAPKVSAAFEMLGEAWGETRGGARGVLVVSTLPTFAASWLAHHLGAFQMVQPDLAVRLETTTRQTDFKSEEVDVVIRRDYGRFPKGLVGNLLVPSDFAPMLSPKLAATIGGVREPADLLKLPQVDPGDSWWRAWFEGAGWPTEALPTHQAPNMGSQAYEAIAAIAGRGVAMLTPIFYKQELENGTLIQPFDHVGSDGSGFWLVYPEERRNVPKIRVFREWILAEVKRTLGTVG